MLSTLLRSADPLVEIQSGLDLATTAESVHDLFEVAQDQRMVKLKQMQQKLQKGPRAPCTQPARERLIS